MEGDTPRPRADRPTLISTVSQVYASIIGTLGLCVAVLAWLFPRSPAAGPGDARLPRLLSTIWSESFGFFPPPKKLFEFYTETPAGPVLVGAWVIGMTVTTALVRRSLRRPPGGDGHRARPSQSP